MGLQLMMEMRLEQWMELQQMMDSREEHSNEDHEP